MPGRNDKTTVALASVGAAVGLTSMKVIVALVTGSLGILAEAAHSGLDLVAALMTLIAIRYAARPPDATHHYGHGKMENLSAFLEAGLLLLTALWVIYEAVRRLAFHEGQIAVSFWAFAVMAISIIVDFSRSRVLLRVARQVGSQALEADALHFSTDIWSSGVVIAGLAVVGLSRHFGWPGWLAQADAVAALGVSGIVLWVSANLARQTIDALLDRAPDEVSGLVRQQVAAVAEVLDVRRTRLRRAGNKFFADLVIAAPRTLTFEQTHTLTEAAEAATRSAIRQSAPQADVDVVVHIEPTIAPSETVRDRIHYLAEEHNVHAHDIHVREVNGSFEAVFDLEVGPHLDLRAADAIAARLEADLLAADPRLSRVVMHLEAPEIEIQPQEDVTDQHAMLLDRVRNAAQAAAGDGQIGAIRIFAPLEPHPAATWDVELWMTFAGQVSLEDAHTRAEAVKRQLRQMLPQLATVTVRTAPADVLNARG